MARLRFAVAALALGLALLLVLLVGYELATARVPEQRVALEELIRRQTGLEVHFSRLALRWGWYGPEAQFQEVELGEPGSNRSLLRARTLVVGLDAWSILRTGRLEARRIQLEYPLIDLIGDRQRSGDGQRIAWPTKRAPEVRNAAASLLAHWRGGQLTVVAGTLRTVLPGSTDPVILGISKAQLQRVKSRWSAEVEVVLPRSLGASMHVSLLAEGPPDLGSLESASVGFTGRDLELSGWGSLSHALAGLPRSGRADVDIRASFLRDSLLSATGHVSAAALAWGARGAAGPELAFDRLRSSWNLKRRERGWELRLERLELDPSPRLDAAPVTLVLQASPDVKAIHGEASHAPLGALLSLVRWYAPGLPPNGLRLGGEAARLSFDWDGERAVGARLSAYADLSGLELRDEARGLRLSGLSGHAAAAESSLDLALHADSARLLLRQESPPLEGLAIETHLKVTGGGEGAWRLEARDLQIQGERLGLRASGSIGAPGRQSPTAIDAQLRLNDADLSLCTELLAEQGPEPWATAARALRGGRVENAELNWRGTLSSTPWDAAGTRFAGSFTLRDATLEGSDLWPAASEVRARVAWQGARVQAAIGQARAAGFLLSRGLASWDLRPQGPLHFSGRLSGEVAELIAWLQSHPRAAPWAAGLSSLDLRGRTVLDVTLASPHVRLAALLDGAQLRAVPGLPPLEALHGTVAFADGHLQRSSLAARWLGGPATLAVGERYEHGLTALLLSGRGVIDVRTAMQTAAVKAQEADISGSIDWSALLTLTAGAGRPRWQLHADSSLAGMASGLPEPFDKVAAAALPLHVDLDALNDSAQLRIALGERLAASAALARTADSWRIERGAVRLGGGTPGLPLEPVMVLDGNVSRLDVAAALALWRLASSDPALPPVRAHLTARQLLAGARKLGEASLAAEAAGGAGSVRLHSSGFVSASAVWPARVDAAHPALLHFARFGLGEPADPAEVAALAAALEPAIDVSVDELEWRGHPLGSLSASLAVRGRTLEVNDLTVAGASTRIHGSARCPESTCSLAFDLDSDDAAQTLAAFGYAPELSAQDAHIEGRLHWLPQAPAPLATLGGSLHMQFEDGTVSPAARAGDSFALLSLPALLRGMAPAATDSGRAALRFARFTADYQLEDGVALTAGVHMDGDAEILLQGRVALSAGEYDEHAWVLRGEDRLPAPVRHFAPRPAVAALWLSLRDLLGIDSSAQARAGLHLRGPWADPIVTAVE